MAGKNTAVFGIYPSYASVENGVDALRSAGFRNEDISALFPEGTGTKEFAHEKNTKAPEGATTGAGSGALVGGAMGWLLGIGAIDETHPLSYGYMGMHGWKHVNRAIQTADLLLAVGMRFDGRGRGWWGGRRNRGSPRWHGHSRIRSQALRGPGKGWRYPAFRSLRKFRVD